MTGAGMLGFNADDGYLEAIARGFRSSLLVASDYVNLTQCESLDDMRMHLNGTDYAPFIQNEPSPLQTSTLVARLTDRLVADFRHLRAHAYEPLAQFLDYLTYPYMIDNLVLLITGALRNRELSELVDRCHPLGVFEGMATLSIVATPEELYREIIVDTPLAPYFVECLSIQDLSELNVEIIRNLLYKAYLEDFYHFCVHRAGGATGELMGPLLRFEADRRAINVTLNSLGTDLSKDERAALFPDLGDLGPELLYRLSKADDPQAVAAALDANGTYRALFQATADHPDRTLEDEFYEHEVKLCKEAFDQQFHYGVFYAYLRLREQEVRNLVWIAECIAQSQKQRMGKIVY